MRPLIITSGNIKQGSEIINSLLTETITFYISVTGNDDTGDGSLSLPWATIDKVFDYLKDKIFQSNITITVKYLSGHYTLNSQITPAHVQGVQIFIEGEKEETNLS